MKIHSILIVLLSSFSGSLFPAAASKQTAPEYIKKNVGSGKKGYKVMYHTKVGTKKKRVGGFMQGKIVTEDIYVDLTREQFEKKYPGVLSPKTSPAESPASSGASSAAASPAASPLAIPATRSPHHTARIDETSEGFAEFHLNPPVEAKEDDEQIID